jgi:hypothetical protein
VDVVMTIRHPAAFVSGLKVKNWQFDFDKNFLEQPLLMRDYLQPFYDEIHEMVRERKDIIDQGILLWKIFYSIIDDFKKKYPNWIFIRHEDLAKNPLFEYQRLYERLGLKFSSKEKTFIETYTSASNPSNAPKQQFLLKSHVNLSVKRNSASSLKNWKTRLTDEEIDRIRNHTSPLSDKFYSASDWA